MTLQKPLGYILGQTMRVYRNRINSVLKESQIELGIDQFLILLTLNARDDLTQQDLAHHLQKDKSIILRQINALLEKRYVVRLPDKDDKRKKNLILTQKGSDTLQQAIDLGKQLSEELLAGISTDDLAVFENVMLKIQQNGGFNEDDGHSCFKQPNTQNE
ncbi:MarR family winged helix-turn-helix transcriptional regulator [Gaoshiqia sediminis]|uniref:MarR family transcriptional regulator n=1 Tax=Gaoshiqia sediminis TaxID=2986998 RepID=A0AA41Y5V9_9BACT|nr:MarR family transcriptional regulator [Gaoshiqia sediminis]MCW0481702.1 MarR family transcriptional regulator [Gaoshiqia sediminis]